MRAHLKQLVSDTATYGIADALSKTLSFLAAPLLTRLLTPADYGTLELLLVFVSLTTPLVLLGLDSALPSFYLDPNICPDEHARKRLVSSILWLLAGWGTVFGMLGWAVAPLVARAVFADKVSVDLLRIAVLVTLASALWWFGHYILRFQFRARLYAVLSVVVAVANVGVGLWVLAGLHQGLGAYYAAYGAVLLVGGLVGLYIIRREISLSFAWSLAWKGLQVGLPFVPATIIYVALSLVDRVMLNHFVPLDHVGWYAIALRVVGVMHAAVAVLGMAWSPLAIKMYYESAVEAQAFYRRVLTYVVALGGLAALTLAALAPAILWIMAPAAYAPAATAVGPLAVAGVALAASHVSTLGPVLKRRPFYVLLLAVLAFGIGIAANLLLIPLWGIVGAAWATALVRCVLAGGAGIVTERLLQPFQYERGLVLTLGVLVVAGTIVIGQAKSANPLVDMGLNALVLVSYVAALGWLGVLRRAHVRMVYNSGVQRLVRLKSWLGGLRSAALPE
jgi:O-antigen/teichoic acid export membrane protein